MERRNLLKLFLTAPILSTVDIKAEEKKPILPMVTQSEFVINKEYCRAIVKQSRRTDGRIYGCSINPL